MFHSPKRRGSALSSFVLRLIALVCMCVDHAGLALFPSASAFRCVGRLAFPLYCFLLTQGFAHTRDIRAYARRLLLLACVSEIPFDLAVNLSTNSILKGHVLEFTSQNVFFTLAIGMIVLTVLEGLRVLQIDTILKTILIVGVTALGAALAYALHTDYGVIGVLAICAAYGFRNQKKELQMAVPCVVLSVLNMSELCALVDAGIVHFYNGKRGLKLKWVFYIFYPLHLLILAGICVLLFK